MEIDLQLALGMSSIRAKGMISPAVGEAMGGPPNSPKNTAINTGFSKRFMESISTTSALLGSSRRVRWRNGCWR